MVELKKGLIGPTTILSELLFLPTIEGDSSTDKLDPSLSKCYLTSYKKYVRQRNYKLGKLNFHLVGTEVSNTAKQTAFFYNNGVRTIAGVEIDIKLYTLQEFISFLLRLIPDDKWYIKNPPPSICLGKAKVERLKESNLAIIKD